MLIGKNYDNAFQFSKVIRQKHCCIFCPEVVRDNVVSNDVTITSALRSDIIIFGKKNSIFLVKWVLRMVHARNCETVSKFVKVKERKL